MTVARRWSISMVAVSAALCLSACLVDRGGTRIRGGGDGGLMDAAQPAQEAGTDAGTDAGEPPPDSGPAPDGGCPPGTVDVNGLPGDGCECTLNSPTTELCNGRDDDCDPTTPDGSGETWFGAPCDGADADHCEEGVETCAPGSGGTPVRTCTDMTTDTPERCNVSGDEDCDGRVDEDGAVDTTLFYRDADGDAHGDRTMSMLACSQPDGYVLDDTDCDDSTPARHPGLAETCDGRDNDCGGDIDEGSVCGCPAVLAPDGRPYLFCTSAQAWAGAQSFCDSTSYRLVVVETATERGWISTTARGVTGGGFWIGLSQDTGGSWVWVDGSSATDIPWHRGEPNNGDFGSDEDCVEINRYSDDRYNDAVCDDAKPFICERP